MVVVGWCTGAQAERPAGIVLYFKSGDDIFLLLADHRESDRGHEGESAAETAARETEEELSARGAADYD